MKRDEYIKKRKYLFWHVRYPEKVSDDVLVETILNYGDWDDVKLLFRLLGVRTAAGIFRKRSRNSRNNYDPEIKNYFIKYFQKYA